MDDNSSNLTNDIAIIKGVARSAYIECKKIYRGICHISNKIRSYPYVVSKMHSYDQNPWYKSKRDEINLRTTLNSMDSHALRNRGKDLNSCENYTIATNLFSSYNRFKHEEALALLSQFLPSDFEDLYAGIITAKVFSYNRDLSRIITDNEWLPVFSFNNLEFERYINQINMRDILRMSDPYFSNFTIVDIINGKDEEAFCRFLKENHYYEIVINNFCFSARESFANFFANAFNEYNTTRKFNYERNKIYTSLEAWKETASKFNSKHKHKNKHIVRIYFKEKIDSDPILKDERAISSLQEYKFLLDNACNIVKTRHLYEPDMFNGYIYNISMNTSEESVDQRINSRNEEGNTNIYSIYVSLEKIPAHVYKIRAKDFVDWVKENITNGSNILKINDFSKKFSDFERKFRKNKIYNNEKFLSGVAKDKSNNRIYYDMCEAVLPYNEYPIINCIYISEIYNYKIQKEINDIFEFNRVDDNDYYGNLYLYIPFISPTPIITYHNYSLMHIIYYDNTYGDAVKAGEFKYSINSDLYEDYTESIVINKYKEHKQKVYRKRMLLNNKESEESKRLIRTLKEREENINIEYVASVPKSVSFDDFMVYSPREHYYSLTFTTHSLDWYRYTKTIHGENYYYYVTNEDIRRYIENPNEYTLEGNDISDPNITGLGKDVEQYNICAKDIRDDFEDFLNDPEASSMLPPYPVFNPDIFDSLGND